MDEQIGQSEASWRSAWQYLGEIDDLKVEAVPSFFRKQFLQYRVPLHHIFPGAQAPALGAAMDVRVDRKGGDGRILATSRRRWFYVRHREAPRDPRK